MSVCRLDHIVITSPTLDAGEAWVRDRLNVTLQTGGEHPQMGTQNRLLRLGEAMYLEVIAVDPDAACPSRPRWFGLDILAPHAQPRLAGWMVRTADIHASATASTEALGRIESMDRGSLEWLLSIPEGGNLVLGGVAPSLIQWQAGSHPASNLSDVGCELVGLDLLHPEPERVVELLDSLTIDKPDVLLNVAGATLPGLVAHIHTPRGIRTLGG